MNKDIRNSFEFWESIENYDKKIVSVFANRDNNIVIETLKNIKNKEFKTILDLGCGVGNSFEYIYDFNSIYAVDFSKNMIEKAKLKDPSKKIKFFNLNLLEIDKINKKFDVILAIMSIFPEKYEDFNIILNNMKKLLNKDGEIYIVVQSIESATLYFQIKANNMFKERKIHPQEIIKKINHEVKLRNFGPFGYFKTTDNIIQKHWLKEELFIRLEDELNFKIKFIKKLELDWQKQFKYNKDQSKHKLWYWFLKIKN